LAVVTTRWRGHRRVVETHVTFRYTRSRPKRDIDLALARGIKNMTKFAITLLAAVLMQPALSVAADKSTHSAAKPNSYVPHPHTNHHVYGAPIQPAIVGRARSSPHKHGLKKRSSNAANRDVQ
jgi:hypothetical protein